MPFTFEPLSIPDLILIKPRVFEDERGYFLETFKRSDFLEAGIEADFVQDNQSLSQKGVMRGLHYQLPPFGQGKLVKVVSGAVFDVAVDIRKGSASYGEWVGVEISSENKYMLWIPPGFAHGLYTLEDKTEFLYKLSAEYAPESERGIHWRDPAIGIEWPFEKGIVSHRDQNLPPLKEAENTFVYEG